jgi:ribosomal protein S18 acetylase RimI-like enzyme
MTYKIKFEESPTAEEIKVLQEGIADHAKQMKRQKPLKFFAYFMRDPEDQIKGGCNGCIYYGSLYVENLWVDKDLRDKNYGTQLMQLAEQFGKENDALFATVNTMDWEALDFYKKLGFEIEFERRGYLNDSIFYFLRKDFQ